MTIPHITICMGSSCYARGNARNAEIIETWLAQRGGGEIELGGTLCEGRCKDGPIVAIEDRIFTRVAPESVEGILESCLGGKLPGSAA